MKTRDVEKIAVLRNYYLSTPIKQYMANGRAGGRGD
jgi:hypothetical protein